MHTLQGWKTLSTLTQGLSSCVTSRVTTVGVLRPTPARQHSSHGADTKSLRTRYDVVIIGAGLSHAHTHTHTWSSTDTSHIINGSQILVCGLGVPYKSGYIQLMVACQTNFKM